MKIFLTGVSCVGKTTIGAKLAEIIGYKFFDLDTFVEEYFGVPLEILQERFLTMYSYRIEAAKAFQHIIDNNKDENYVVALPPSGLIGGYLSVIKKTDCVVIAIHDNPVNLLNRITFYDKNSEPIKKTLDEVEKKYYLNEIKKDITYFGRSYKRANLHVDIAGLGVENSAKKIAGTIGSCI